MVEAVAPYIAVLLAAGQGTRFGSGKLLHPLADGVAIAAHAARNLRSAGLEIVAVVRAGDFALYELLEEEGCFVTMCRDAVFGMGHSLAHGVRESAAAAGWVVALADMPSIRPSTTSAVVAALRAGVRIAAPVYHGTRGHPVGFARSCYDGLVRLTGDSGARPVLELHRDAVVLLDCGDPGVLYDIDRKADLAGPALGHNDD
jgi:molybdenum cofactor cytidylyltransferase